MAMRKLRVYTGPDAEQSSVSLLQDSLAANTVKVSLGEPPFPATGSLTRPRRHRQYTGFGGPCSAKSGSFSPPSNSADPAHPPLVGVPHSGHNLIHIWRSIAGHAVF